MKSRRDIVKAFSKLTGITDPKIDTILASEETKLESVEDFTKHTGISDPRIDHFIDVQDDEGYIHSGAMYGIDWGKTEQHSWRVSDTLNYNSWVHSDYRPHPAQERFHREPYNNIIFGGRRRGFSICEAVRNMYRNYIEGTWRESPKKLTPPPLKLED